MDRMVAYCGIVCDEYACEMLLDFFKLVPQAQAVLDGLYASR